MCSAYSRWSMYSTYLARFICNFLLYIFIANVHRWENRTLRKKYIVSSNPLLNCVNIIVSCGVNVLSKSKILIEKEGGWDRERNKWSQKLGGANTEIQKLRTHDLELIGEVMQ